MPLGLVPQTILERTARVLLSDEELYRFRVVKLGELMAVEALGENERALFGQEAMNKRYRELDEREIRLDARDKRLTGREEGFRTRNRQADERESEADIRERDQMELDVRRQRQE